MTGRLPAATLVLAAALAVAPAGCSGTASTPASPPEARFDVRALRERALETLDRGVLFKPAQAHAETLEYEMAPLIVREPTGDASTADPVERVYWTQDEVAIGDRDHARWTFYWRDGGAAQGIRMTLDSQGLPAVWEVLRADAPRRVVYVSGNLEAAAADAHGDPGADGFAVERPGAWIVARRIEAGPMALGPFVYERRGAGDSRGVTSVLCRCMPSQVVEIPGTAEYDLVEAELDEQEPPDWGDDGPAEGLRLDAVEF